MFHFEKILIALVFQFDSTSSSVISDYLTVLSNPVFRWTVFGYAMQTFVVGGYASFGKPFHLEEVCSGQHL